MSEVKHGSVVEIDCDCCHLLYEQGVVFDGLPEDAREAFAAIADETLHAVATALARLATVDSMEKGELLLGSFNQCMVILAEACRKTDDGDDDAPVPGEARYGMYL